MNQTQAYFENRTTEPEYKNPSYVKLKTKWYWLHTLNIQLGFKENLSL